jgi:hypothetical protein
LSLASLQTTAIMISFRQSDTVVKLLLSAFASALVLLAICHGSDASPFHSSPDSTPARPGHIRRRLTGIDGGAEHFGQAELQSDVESLCSRFDWEVHTIFDVVIKDNKLDCLESRIRAMTQVDCFIIVERYLDRPGQGGPLLVKDHLHRFEELQEQITLVEGNVADEQLEDKLPRTRVSDNPLIDVVLSDLPGDQRRIEEDIIISGDVHDLARSDVLKAMRSCQSHELHPGTHAIHKGPWKVPAGDGTHHAAAGAPRLWISTAADRHGKHWDIGSMLTEAWGWCSPSVALQKLIDSIKTFVNAEMRPTQGPDLLEIYQAGWRRV